METFTEKYQNYSDNNNIEAALEIVTEDEKKPVLQKTISVNANHTEKVISDFSLSLKEGNYISRVTVLGNSVEGKIVVKDQPRGATAREEDLDGDGIPEIVLENDKIRATVLLYGGRVIEYIVKSRNENLLFKLWPTRPPWADEPKGYRAFYPWGGLEEFIGYPYIGGQTVYKYKIEKSSGNYARVRVWVNVHGSRIEKTMTLMGGSQLLETRFALNDIDHNIHIAGINPLVEIGPSTGPEDIYYFPVEEIETRSPELERYYGSIFNLKEGWVAGHDTKMNISLIVGYPVNAAMFMHLWNNHPNNTPTPYFYTELQPWIMLKHGTTTYFTYYLYGKDGDWKPALEEFRDLRLVTKRTTAHH